MSVTVCGAVCDTCPQYQNICGGCSETQGKVFWASSIQVEACPIYECSVTKKNYSHCGECPELPCELFHTLKDPSATIEAHEKGVLERVARLGKR